MKNLGSDYDLARAQAQELADLTGRPVALAMADSVDDCWFLMDEPKSGHIVIYPSSDPKSRGCGEQVKWRYDQYGGKMRTEYFH